MKNIFYTIALGACLTASMHSCSLDEYNPTMVSEQETLDTYRGWKGLQTTCYKALGGHLFNFEYMALAEVGTDTWVSPFNRTWAQEVFYYEGLTTNTSYPNMVFKTAYSMIENCNKVIDRAGRIKDGVQADMDVLVAEAHCLRGFYYLLLVTHYGNVTLNVHESEDINLRPTRSTVEEIYRQVVSDLKYAAENLKTTPFEGNYARCTQKTALGLLARAYAQGAGEGLEEDGVSYWECARVVAEDLIQNQAAYGAYTFDDVEDMWAQANNRNNKEALFIASGANALDPSWNVSKSNNILSYVFPNPNKLADIYKTNNKSNYFYGRANNNVMAPSKYLIDCFDADYDKRWENSFVTAFAEFSMEQEPGWGIRYDKKTLELTAEICQTYGIDAKHVGKKIYPYVDIQPKPSVGGNQYVASVWPKGDHTANTDNLQAVKNVYVHPYPLAADEDRFLIYLSKDKLTAAEKAERAYFCVNLDDMFDDEGKYKSVQFDGTDSYQLFPALSKYNWNYEGAFHGGNLQYKGGDIAIMRMAEVYLIAAEANVMLNKGDKAAEHLNVLRKRACRDAADYEAHMKLKTDATMEDVYDEYARELCGEFGRWALLKRHQAFEDRLQKYNIRAARTFTKKNYLRPISYDFLSQIDNADEYGTNGY